MGRYRLKLNLNGIAMKPFDLRDGANSRTIQPGQEFETAFENIKGFAARFDIIAQDPALNAQSIQALIITGREDDAQVYDVINPATKKAINSAGLTLEEAQDLCKTMGVTNVQVTSKAKPKPQPQPEPAEDVEPETPPPTVKKIDENLVIVQRPGVKEEYDVYDPVTAEAKNPKPMSLAQAEKLAGHTLKSQVNEDTGR